MADAAPDLFGFAMVDSRPDDDYYPTPLAVIAPLLDREDLAGGIWEPACGEGAIVRALATAGHPVVATDLVDRGVGTGGRDFLAARRMARLPDGRPARHIVTNPPYRLARPFADRALALLPPGGLCALLLRLAFLEGQARRDWWQDGPLARVWVSSRRLTLYPAGWQGAKSRGTIAFAWFVWVRGHTGKPALGWF